MPTSNMAPVNRPHITVNMAPPQLGAARHIRRPAAEHSVSLVQSPRRQVLLRGDSNSTTTSRDGQAMSSEGGANSLPARLKPASKGSSGESSNAEHWFDSSNNAVVDNRAATNDPPFFMRNMSSSESPHEAHVGAQQQYNDSYAMPRHAGLMHLGTEADSTDEYRGVIDDLTVENKKLKRRLKKYEKLHDAHLKDEKLFEVRIHGLPAAKKWELEETLRKFAASLGTEGIDRFPASGYQGQRQGLKHLKASSSQTSLNNTDSAYASMSASGHGSSAPSGSSSRHRKVTHPSASSRHQNIQTYLHDIPEGLMPQTNPAALTEQARKMLVVRRLEQIFAGKGAAALGHSHPLQQEEVSQTAARADRTELAAQGRSVRGEGHREAQIMAEEEKDDAEAVIGVAELGKPPTRTSEEDSKLVPLEQRPTRPLDLDPHRAQVPSENVRYMRHLGFSPSSPDAGRSPEEGHGWVYLNLLINMAQLHTINVTADFVRKALADCSDRFEVSEDGRKVRWKRPAGVVRIASPTTSPDAGATQDGQTQRKRAKQSHQEGARSARLRPDSKLFYTPLFHHNNNAESSEDSFEDDSDSMSPYPQRLHGDSSGMTSSGVRTTSTKRKRVVDDDGPIIFYNGARFCTDLSGHRQAESNPNAPAYTRISTTAVGERQPVGRTTFESRGPLNQAAGLPEPMSLDSSPAPDFVFETLEAMTSPVDENEEITELEVTGIGGVWPADNFSVNVQSRLDQAANSAGDAAATNSLLPARLKRHLYGSVGGSTSRLVVNRSILSTKLRFLQPSMLPPASYMYYGDDMSDDASELSSAQRSISSADSGDYSPAAAPQVIDFGFDASDEEEVDDDDGEESSDSGSLDLLAAARELDPEAIRAREREYDANMAERMAEEIPAGSSAATAGGGSGLCSPAFKMQREEYQRVVKEVKDARAAKVQAGEAEPREVSGDEKMGGVAS